MVLYVLLVSTANLALGFALAFYLGRRCQALAGAEGWIVPLELPLPGGVEAAIRPAKAEPIGGSTSGSPLGATLDNCRQRVEHYTGELSDVDDALRQFTISMDTAAIQSCLTRLDTATSQYVEQNEQVLQEIDTCMAAHPEWDHSRHNLQMAKQLVDAEVEAVRQGIAAFDPAADPVANGRELSEQTHRLISANDHFRDHLDGAAAAAARSSTKRSIVERTDALTGCLSLTTSEARLAGWLKDHPGSIACVAMLDIDQFSLINKAFGHKVGDRLLAAIGAMLREEQSQNVSIARFSGQRFLLTLLSTELADAVNTVERIRQSMEKACFVCGETPIRAAASCGVTVSQAGDTTDGLFERAETAMTEAKHHGRNRTFVFQVKFPTPVTPPRMTINERTIDL